MTDPTASQWWQSGIIYQIYPRSFQDATGSGVGDLSGIRSRLGHVAHLGADTIWISPIFPSPMRDGGYDISDYTGIEPMFGTLDDFDALLTDAHDRGIRVLLDFVPSHSSDQHPWFVESRASRDNPKRDWYRWHDAAPHGGPPNNWISEFGGPAWTWDGTTGQYYLNIYATSQPALNWRNPDVRRAMYDTMRFWFDRGVDGFRVDAVEHLAPSMGLEDNPSNPEWSFEMGPAQSLFREHTSHQPEVFEIAREMRAVADEYQDRVLIGEAYGRLDQVMRYYGETGDGFHLPFNFELINAPWAPRHIADYADTYEGAIPDGGWPNWVLGNHDRSRIASRVGPDQARVAAMLLLTLRGTPTLWQGDELGMVDEPVPREMWQDPWAINNPETGLGRDPVRIPIPWQDDAPGRGFTDGTPFLPLSSVASAAAQQDDPASMLTLTRALVALRRSNPALTLGAYRPIHADAAVYAFERAHGDARAAVALNFTDRVQPLPKGVDGTARLSTIHDRDLRTVTELLPNEGVVFDRI